MREDQENPATANDGEKLQEALKDPAALEKLGDLLNGKDQPLHVRFRALFTLKAINTPAAVEIISKGFEHPSALLRHELAYVLGQMHNPAAIDTLNRILATTTEDPMVRHEAAEALGAIGQPSSLEILNKYLKDPCVVVAETCELAIAKIQLEQSKSKEESEDVDGNGTVFTTIDPAPPSKKKSVEELQKQLLDTSLPLFERYRAMFALRNINTEASAMALTLGLNDKSALFRHEIAYVLGQLAHPATSKALIEALNKMDEEPMVRHECAEALGSIATEDVMPVLEKFRQDQEPVVRESCEIALDMYEYENSDQFQYADGLARAE